MATRTHNLKERLSRIELANGSDLPLYVQLRNALRVQIQTDFKAEEPFYSEMMLTAGLPVSQMTVRRALSDLVTEGLVRREKGRGTIVEGANARTRALAATQPRTSPPAERLQTTIIMPNVSSEYPFLIVDQFTRQCAARHMRLNLVHSKSDGAVESTLKQITGSPELERIVLFESADMTQKLFDALSSAGYRTVAVDGVLQGYAGSFVNTNASAAMRIGINHLQHLGHIRIVLLVNEPNGEPTVSEKITAFREIAVERGLQDSVRVVDCARDHYENSYHAAFSHMDQAWLPFADGSPTAIMTVSDPGAWAALKWLTERGFSVPGDVSVLGFEDVRSSRYMSPALSSTAHQVEALVRRMLQVLWDEPVGAVVQERLMPVLMARQSTGRAPEQSTRRRTSVALSKIRMKSSKPARERAAGNRDTVSVAKV